MDHEVFRGPGKWFGGGGGNVRSAKGLFMNAEGLQDAIFLYREGHQAAIYQYGTNANHSLNVLRQVLYIQSTVRIGLQGGRSPRA